jgi:hypothetical protein
MTEKADIAVLKSEIAKTLAILGQNSEYYREFLDTDYKLLGEKNSSAIVIAEIITDFYTCLETQFLRISQFFENHLNHEKWHRDLLEKMTLDIRGIRPRAISDKTFCALLEILKFRHFRRYYYEFEYDWNRIRALQQTYESIHPRIREDLNQFLRFLDELERNGE